MLTIMILPLFAGVGGQEVLIIVFLILLLFGGKKIPELMKGLGKGVRSFKEGMNEVEEKVTSTDTTIAEQPEKRAGSAFEDQ